VEAGRRSSRSGGEVFGRLVAVRRAGLGLRQEDLAARIDTSQANVARIEEGQPPSTETLTRLAAALNVQSGAGAPSSRTRIWNLDAEAQRLAIAVLIPVVVILGGALSVVIHGFGGGGRFSGPDGADPSQQSPQAVAVAPAVPLVAAAEAQGKTRKAKKTTKKPEKKSAPAAAVSEPSLARAPTTKKRSPAPTQPASEPVASSPPPSNSGASKAPPQAQNDPPPQAEHGIGGGEASHGIAPAGG
jgi:transcriptional regulator with XRE-family HTH domain